jgi:hypothetical protein
VEELWQDALNKSRNIQDDLKLSRGQVVKLIDFDLADWFPWLPGMYWTP